MIKLLIRWAIVALGLWVAITFVPGIHGPQDWPSILALALIFGLVNALVRPLLTLLTCPFIILTLGLGILLINTLMFWLTGQIGQYVGVGLTFDNFWAAFFGALVVSIISVVLNVFVKDDREWRWRERK